MSVTVVVQTQRIEVSPGTPRIIFSPQDSLVEVQSPTPSVSVINAGPPGPPGTPGEVNLVPVIEEIDTRIATHNQTAPIHESATSGRDFVALFQNGLV